MKKKSCGLVIFLMIFILAGCQIRKDDYFIENGCFRVECINASQNSTTYNLQQNDSYYYITSDGLVYCYDYEEEKNELAYATENAIIEGKIKGEYFIYTYSYYSQYKVNRVNLKQKKEECIYEEPSSAKVRIGLIDNDALIQVCNDECVTYRCPINGDFTTQMQQINVNEHLTSGISTDNEQYTYLAGRNIVVKKDERTQVNMYFSYQVEGEPEKYIDCFNKKGYADSRLVKGYLTEENEDEIRGIMCVSDNPIESVMLYQRDIVRDMLFSLNIDTGESQILYDTKNNQTRIVGYEDGILYLFKNDYKVYKQPLSGGEATEILSIPRSNDVTFDWYGDYMFVIYRDTNTELRYKQPYDVQAVKVK